MRSYNTTRNWAQRFYDDLKRHNLPVEEIIINPDAIKLLLIENRKKMTINVNPKGSWNSRINYYKSTEKYIVSYRCDTSRKKEHQLMVDKFIRFLEYHEKYLPTRIEDYASIGIEKKEPHIIIEKTYPFLEIERSEREGGHILYEVLTRITSKCNQKCPFCSSPLPQKQPSLSALKGCFDKIDKILHPSMIVLTGGEPTIRKDLIDLANFLLKLKNIYSLQIQTNAVIIGLKPERFIFPESDKLSFFVSLHGLNSKAYDICTNSRGQLPLAVKGIRELQKQGHRITINCVFNKVNINHIERYVSSLPKVLHENNLPDLHFSIMMCPEYREKAPEFLVPYSLVAKKLESVYTLSRNIGFNVSSLLGSTHASIPACLLSEEFRTRSVRPEIYDHEVGYEDYSKLWVKAKRCEQCKETRYCLGLPRPYAIRFGFGELKPI